MKVGFIGVGNIGAIESGRAGRDASIFLTLREERAKVQVRLPATSSKGSDAV
jgi:hypothetical protein